MEGKSLNHTYISIIEKRGDNEIRESSREIGIESRCCCGKEPREESEERQKGGLIEFGLGIKMSRIMF